MDFARVCVLVFALCNTVHVLRAATQTATSGPGKYCNATMDCSSVANATCSNNKCDCLPAFKVNGIKCSPKGLGDNCTNDAHCIAVNHSTCDTPTNNKCICPATHKAVSGQCKIKVIGATCSVGSKVCSLQHSECASGNKCACKVGYYNSNDQCLKALGSACESGNASTVCTTPNAACNTTTKLCACTAGFVAEDVACPIAVGQTCKSATECTSNADCDDNKKCTCKDGLKNVNGLCAPSSAAGEHRLAVSIFGASLLLTILKLF